MSFHLYQINELYSNADGSIQFIELKVGNFNGESFLQGQTISVTQGSATSPPPPPYTYAIGDTTHTYTFTSNLPSTLTANTSVLIATQGFANLGIVKPDYIVPSGFLFIDGGTVNYAGVDSVTYSALPTDGTSSINRSGTIGVNSPTDFAGFTGTIPGNPIAGTDSADNLTGTGSNDFIVGVDGNDTLTGAGGNDTIDGGAGVDTAVFNSNRAGNTITKTASGHTVSGADGNDTLSNIERLKFSDKSLAVDMGASEAGGKTALLLGACLGANGLSNQATVGGILGYFDGGFTLTDAAMALVDAGIVAQLAGGADNKHFVDWMALNLVDALPDASTEAVLIDFITSGQFTQATFLATLAAHQINQDHIGLVGLQQNGMEYL